MAKINGRRFQVCDRVRMVEHITNMFFPDVMPGHPEYAGANDNSHAKAVLWGAAGLFQEILKMPADEGLVALEIIGNFQNQAIEHFRGNLNFKD